MIYAYGEERYSRRIASAIVEARRSARIENAKDLADIIYRAVPAQYRHGAIHPATKTFQALRIAVNKELDRLPRVLDSAFNVLKVGGKLGVITFHSLEDRAVKNNFKTNENPCTCPKTFPVCVCGKRPKGSVITRKPIVPSEGEQEDNPRSKSAKLRVFERNDEVWPRQ